MKKIILLLLLALTIIPMGCKLSKKTNAVSVSESFVTPDPADVVRTLTKGSEFIRALLTPRCFYRQAIRYCGRL